MLSRENGNRLFKAQVRRPWTFQELGLIAIGRLVLTSPLLSHTLTDQTTPTLIETDSALFNRSHLTLQSTPTPAETTIALTRQDKLINQTLLPLKVQLLESDEVRASHESSKSNHFLAFYSFFCELT